MLTLTSRVTLAGACECPQILYVFPLPLCSCVVSFLSHMSSSTAWFIPLLR